MLGCYQRNVMILMLELLNLLSIVSCLNEKFLVNVFDVSGSSGLLYFKAYGLRIKAIQNAYTCLHIDWEEKEQRDLNFAAKIICTDPLL